MYGTEPGTFFHNFITRTKGMSPDERATALEEDDALDAAQAVATREGVTAVPDVNDAVNAHFICFVCVLPRVQLSLPTCSHCGAREQ